MTINEKLSQIKKTINEIKYTTKKTDNEKILKTKIDEMEKEILILKKGIQETIDELDEIFGAEDVRS
tara:strand:- start:176 stop:376 length:201 start_codon:yes stop_codon:yes gene_type:complete